MKGRCQSCGVVAEPLCSFAVTGVFTYRDLAADFGDTVNMCYDCVRDVQHLAHMYDIGNPHSWMRPK